MASFLWGRKLFWKLAHTQKEFFLSSKNFSLHDKLPQRFKGSGQAATVPFSPGACQKSLTQKLPQVFLHHFLPAWNSLFLKKLRRKKNLLNLGC